MRVSLISGIINTVQTLWPEAMVIPFGSFISGLFLPNRYAPITFALAAPTDRAINSL